MSAEYKGLSRIRAVLSAFLQKTSPSSKKTRPTTNTQPPNQATKQPSNQATTQPSNQATKQPNSNNNNNNHLILKMVQVLELFVLHSSKNVKNLSPVEKA